MMNALGIRANEADLKVHLTFHSLSTYITTESFIKSHHFQKVSKESVRCTWKLQMRKATKMAESTSQSSWPSCQRYESKEDLALNVESPTRLRA